MAQCDRLTRERARCIRVGGAIIDKPIVDELAAAAAIRQHIWGVAERVSPTIPEAPTAGAAQAALASTNGTHH